MGRERPTATYERIRVLAERGAGLMEALDRVEVGATPDEIREAAESARKLGETLDNLAGCAELLDKRYDAWRDDIQQWVRELDAQASEEE